MKLGNLVKCDQGGVDYLAKKADSLWAEGRLAPEAKFDVTLPNGKCCFYIAFFAWYVSCLNFLLLLCAGIPLFTR